MKNSIPSNMIYDIYFQTLNNQLSDINQNQIKQVDINDSNIKYTNGTQLDNNKYKNVSLSKSSNQLTRNQFNNSSKIVQKQQQDMNQTKVDIYNNKSSNNQLIQVFKQDLLANKNSLKINDNNAHNQLELQVNKQLDKNQYDNKNYQVDIYNSNKQPVVINNQLNVHKQQDNQYKVDIYSNNNQLKQTIVSSKDLVNKNLFKNNNENYQVSNNNKQIVVNNNNQLEVLDKQQDEKIKYNNDNNQLFSENLLANKNQEEISTIDSNNIISYNNQLVKQPEHILKNKQVILKSYNQDVLRNKVVSKIQQDNTVSDLENQFLFSDNNQNNFMSVEQDKQKVPKILLKLTPQQFTTVCNNKNRLLSYSFNRYNTVFNNVNKKRYTVINGVFIDSNNENNGSKQDKSSIN